MAKSSLQTSKAFCFHVQMKMSRMSQSLWDQVCVFVRILNNSPNDWISTWECAILTAGINWPSFPDPTLLCWVRIFLVFGFSFKAKCPLLVGWEHLPKLGHPKVTWFSKLQVESPWMSLALGSLNRFQPKPKGPEEPGSLLCLQSVWISKPSCSKDGSHKFPKRKDPGWLLVPELWNSEGPQQAQTLPLCRNVGLTGSWELRFLPLTHSQQAQKVVSPCGCYFDKLKLQGTVNLCSSVLLFLLDAAETRQKCSIWWTGNISLGKK